MRHVPDAAVKCRRPCERWPAVSPRPPETTWVLPRLAASPIATSIWPSRAGRGRLRRGPARRSSASAGRCVSMADGGAPRIAHMGGTVDRHPLASVGSLVLGLRCLSAPARRRCRSSRAACVTAGRKVERGVIFQRFDRLIPDFDCLPCGLRCLRLLNPRRESVENRCPSTRAPRCASRHGEKPLDE
jgi:hypothetical protein